MTTVTTRQGDTWDILSKRLYGDELFMSALINANISHRKTVIFPAGVILNAPDIDMSAAEYNRNLPPWAIPGGE